MTQQTARPRFKFALFGLGDRWESGAEQLGAEVAAGLLAFGPETAALAAAAGQLAVSVEEDAFGRRNFGLCLRDYDVRLAEIVWLADGRDVPEQVKQQWPNLTQQEWDCALRVAKLVLSALGSPSIQNDKALPNPARARFRAALSAVGDRPGTAPEELARNVTGGLLAFGSETPDNLAAAEQLDVSVEQDENGWNVGLCMRRSGLRLSRLLRSAVGSPVPQQMLEDLPDLVQEDWDTVLTVTTAILAALESDPV
ncbi:hypothetical protein [Kitasatospora sp. GP82]|uniref:hypothetical protein n=1 Tax=Kitasatospora sp. GP82 TaxID=3035089 RepID=UPI0024744CA9|nr:hypothetical protein [Kitasatospora sp. GP82]MDH6127546.1 hypothetical protein [Kitasatospora sp. GP82]